MWHARILFLMGTWLIVSGFASPLQRPGNMLTMGFLTVIYCFRLSRFWQVPVTGIVGAGLFLSGLNDWIALNSLNMVTQLNFLVSGGLLIILAMLIFVSLMRAESPQSHLKIS